MPYTYLALGDSYTIGEQVLLAESFPYQTVQLLRNAGKQFTAPEIIAKTGWTTDELLNAIENRFLLDQYDFVSLLIGVNNQYRGRKASEFKIEFEHLLQLSIQFAANIPSHVFVLSIPDWGVTPFANGRNSKQVAEEIDEYNEICRTSSLKYNVHFIDITQLQRADGHKPEFLAGDGLHPSRNEYTKWASLFSKAIISSIAQNEQD